jgi:5-methylcytosine-specific restriction endonuclease McrA
MPSQTVRATTQSTRVHKTGDRKWQELAARFRAHCKRHKQACWLCTEPINYELRTGPWCFEADHAKPRKLFPHLMFEWSNLRPSHRRCNRARGCKPIDDGMDNANVVGGQQDWVKPTW